MLITLRQLCRDPLITLFVPAMPRNLPSCLRLAQRAMRSHAPAGRKILGGGGGRRTRGGAGQEGGLGLTSRHQPRMAPASAPTGLRRGTKHSARAAARASAMAARGHQPSPGCAPHAPGASLAACPWHFGEILKAPQTHQHPGQRSADGAERIPPVRRVPGAQRGCFGFRSNAAAPRGPLRSGNQQNHRLQQPGSPPCRQQPTALLLPTLCAVSVRPSIPASPGLALPKPSSPCPPASS